MSEAYGLLDETIGAKRKPVKLITKVFPTMQHHIGATSGVIKENNGGTIELLGGSGQGNVFSGEPCRDVSCVIFRRLKKKKVGILIRSSYNGNIEKRVEMAHVDDDNSCTSGKDCEKKMQ